MDGSCTMRMVILFFFALTGQAEAQELDSQFVASSATGTIVVERLSDGRRWTANPARAQQRFLPASTFKIVNSLIILETRVVNDPQADILEWDGLARGGGWDQNQNLRLAFRRSAVWAFQEWARRVGHAEMQHHVSAMEYGSGDIGSAVSIDTFWLNGPLEISAQEQIDFLQRLHARSLPIRAGVMDAVVEVMEADRGENWVLRAKTGWAIRDTPNVGWYVGWLETEGDVYFFALNMELDYAADDGRERIEIALSALEAVTDLDLLSEH